MLDSFSNMLRNSPLLAQGGQCPPLCQLSFQPRFECNPFNLPYIVRHQHGTGSPRGRDSPAWTIFQKAA